MELIQQAGPPRPVIRPSKYQLAIFDWIDRGKGNAFVEAVAGSGKTTTLKKASERLRGAQSLFLAFNKHIVAELREKLPRSMKVSTIHGIGLKTLTKAFGDVQLDEYKYEAILKNYLSQREDIEDKDVFEATVMQVWRYVQAMLINPDKPEEVEGVIEHFSIDVEAAHKPHLFAALPVLAYYGKILAREKKIISFSDMLWLPSILHLVPYQYDWVFVDEAQDLTPAQREMALKCKSRFGRILFVGDRCQPEGTMVRVPVPKTRRGFEFNEVPIEMLQVGDQVVSYSPSDCAFIQKGRRVNGVTKRPYSGDLIVVRTSGGLSSRYTPNHHCYASFEPLRSRQCVYMMQRGNQFRIGSCRMAYSHASGPVFRMRCEGADALWILAVYEDPSEALMMEQAISGRFGIPQLIFSEKAVEGSRTSEVLDKAWAWIGENSSRAQECLTHFGRDIRYPLVRASDGYASLKRPMVVHACNLLDGCKVLPHMSHHTKSADWQSIMVEREPYEGYVYSLDVEGEHLYVADGLVTHNCQAIYGFTGADAESVQNIEITRAERFPLSICYRCPKSHIELAKQIVPEIEAAEDAPEGVIKSISPDEITKIVQEGDLVLCRTTAPLIEQCFSLLQAGITARVKGRDIGKDLTTSLRKIVRHAEQHYGGFNFPSILNHIAQYRSDAIAGLQGQTGADMKAAAISDKMSCLQVIFTTKMPANLDAYEAAIQEIFSDSKVGVMLSTIHRAKGLEADRVIILKPDLMPHPNAKADWEVEQEQNLRYVAYTRAKQELYFVEEAKKR